MPLEELAVGGAKVPSFAPQLLEDAEGNDGRDRLAPASQLRFDTGLRLVDDAGEAPARLSNGVGFRRGTRGRVITSSPVRAG